VASPHDVLAPFARLTKQESALLSAAGAAWLSFAARAARQHDIQVAGRG